MKHNIAEPYISALEEQNKIANSWRAYQNFIECCDPQLLEKFKTQANEIEAIIIKERELYV